MLRFLRRLLEKLFPTSRVECDCGHFEFPSKIYRHRYHFSEVYPEESVCTDCYWKEIRAEAERIHVRETDRAQREQYYAEQHDLYNSL